MEDVLNLENIYPYQRRIPERTKLRPEGKAHPPYLRVWMTTPSPPPLLEGVDPPLLTLFLLFILGHGTELCCFF